MPRTPTSVNNEGAQNHIAGRSAIPEHQHLGATVYYDRSHEIIKVRLSGGGYGELVKERQGGETYRDQICVIAVSGRDPVILQYA